MGPYVYRGLWTSEHEPFPNRWLWTVSNTEALLLSVVIGIYIIYAGSKLWVLLKIIFIPGIYLVETIPQRTAGSRDIDPQSHDELELASRTDLEDVDNTLPEQQITAANNLKDCGFSTRDAIQAWLGFGKHKPRVEMLRKACNERALRRLSILALLNSLLTIVFAPFIPWLLTGLGRGLPVVRSTFRDACGWTNLEYVRDGALERSARLAETQLLSCLPDLDEQLGGCGTKLWPTAFPALSTTETTCPFDPIYCANSSEAIRLEHRLLPGDLGFNSLSKLEFHHALSCAPLQLGDDLIFPSTSDNTSSMIFFLALGIPDEELTTDHIANYMLRLNTLNGPNTLSSNFSGWAGNAFDRTHSGAMYVTITPTMRSANRSSEMYRLLRPGPLPDNGTVFFITFNAGRTMFEGSDGEPIHDPIFKSTRRMKPNAGYYLPDQDVTALGCVEQFRFCLQKEEIPSKGSSKCVPWFSNFVVDALSFVDEGSTASRHPAVDSVILEFGKHLDLWDLYSNMFIFSSVERYFRNNRHFILADSRRNGHQATLSDSSAQWVLELKMLFQASLLNARLVLHDMITQQGKDVSQHHDSYLYTRACDRLLFFDGGYTNISFLWLCFLLAVISVPVLYDWGRQAKRIGLFLTGRTPPDSFLPAQAHRRLSDFGKKNLTQLLHILPQLYNGLLGMVQTVRQRFL